MFIEYKGDVSKVILKAEIKLKLEYIRAWGGRFVTAVPALRISP